MKKRWIAIGLAVIAAVGAGLYGGKRPPPLAPPLTIHSGGRVAKLVLSPDGRLLADASLGQVLLYDTETGAQKYAFAARAYSVHFSPDGGRLLTLSTRPSPTNPNGTVQVWDVATGAQISRFVPPGQATAPWPHIAAISRDLQWVIVCGGQRCTVYDIATGGFVKTLPLPDPNSQVLFSPDRGLLVLDGSATGGLQIWDTKTWRLISRLGNQVAGVRDIRFSPDGARLALGSKAGLAWWNTHTWKPEGRFSLPFSAGLSRDNYYFSSDSRSLLVSRGSLTSDLHQVDCDTGRETLSVPSQTPQHMSLTGNRGQTSVGLGKHQYFLYRESYDIWDTARRQVLYQITPLPGPNSTLMGDYQPHSTDLSADGHVFAVGGSDDGVIQVWRLP